MKFDPNRCGSFSASADTRGDTTSAKLIDPEPAKTPGDTPAGHIIPAYVKSDPAALVGFVRQHMSFLKATTSLNRMIQAIEKPQNKLFDRLYPEILNIEDASYICLSNDLFAKGKSQGQVEICDQVPDGAIATAGRVSIFYQPTAALREARRGVYWTAASGKDRQPRACGADFRV